MEAKFVLGCLLVASISNRLSVSLRSELSPVRCVNCTCVSENGVKLPLSTFSPPVQLSSLVCGCAPGCVRGIVLMYFCSQNTP